MTREEAILWLQVLKHSKINWVGEKAEEEDIIARCEEAEQEAFNIAIEALSAEPTEDYSDLPDIPRAYYEKIVGNMSHEINMLKEQLESADAVPTVIRAKTFMRKEDFDKWAEDIKRQNKSIVCIPCDAEVVSADAVQGEWIEREDWNGDYYYDCSVCGESFVLCDGTPSMNLYHFCPNCGARMKGGAE